MEQNSRRRVEGATVKAFAQVFYFSLIDRGLAKYLAVSEPLALVISATIVFLPAYWVSPKPQISFPRYAVAIESMMAVLVLALTAPDLLRRYMPVQLACGLPLLLSSLPLYYVLLRLDPNIMRRVGLFKWALGSLILALVAAGAATVLPEAR